MSHNPEQVITGRKPEHYICPGGYRTAPEPDSMWAISSTRFLVPTGQYQIIEGSPVGTSNSINAGSSSYDVSTYQEGPSVHLQTENTALAQYQDPNLTAGYTYTYSQQGQGHVGESSSYIANPTVGNCPSSNCNTGTFYSSENHY